MSAPDRRSPQLKCQLTLPRLVFYGVGTILGAGIFVVIGEVVGAAGALTPLAYLLAGLIASATALSYAEMGARVPTAGGPIDYVQNATGSRTFGSALGWLLVAASIVSAATITTGFVSYLRIFVDLYDWVPTSLLVVALGAIACRGIEQSAWFMTATTLIGIATLIAVAVATRSGIAAAPSAIAEGLRSFDISAATGLLAGAFLAVYSFIGFGDMALTAEEVIDVKRTLPKAILITMGIVFFFYLLISAALVGAGPTDHIAHAEAPLVAAVAREGWPTWPVGIASLCVIVNGALTQIISAARLLLDIGRDGRGAPAAFGVVSEKTGTPVVATVCVATLVLGLALFVPLKTLAQATSFIILIVFASVNGALFLLKRQCSQPADVPNVGTAIPLTGLVTCCGAIVVEAAQFLG